MSASLTLVLEINALGLDPFCLAHLRYCAYKCLDSVISGHSFGYAQGGASFSANGIMVISARGISEVGELQRVGIGRTTASSHACNSFRPIIIGIPCAARSSRWIKPVGS